MRLETWNVNSIRSRIERVEDWLKRADLDVLAIQETKAREDQFPYLTFDALGYEVAHVGFNQWNGVAIASRVGLADVEVGFDGMPGWGEPIESEARAIGRVLGLVAGGTRDGAIRREPGVVEQPAPETDALGRRRRLERREIDVGADGRYRKRPDGIGGLPRRGISRPAAPRSEHHHRDGQQRSASHAVQYHRARWVR